MERINQKAVPDLVDEMMRARRRVGVPSHFKFTGRERLHFLANNGLSTEIYTVNIPYNDIATDVEWNPLINIKLDSNTPLSKEEQLRRERMRAAATGISTYDYHEELRRFLIQASDSLFVIEGEEKPHIRELNSDESGARIDPSFSPDGYLVAYVRHNDLWVQNVSTLHERRLTMANPQNDPNCKKGIGIAEYIMQEEFDRYTGYWWAPKTDRSPYRILCAAVDESHLPTFSIADQSIRGNTDAFTYPLVGDPNADFDLVLVEIGGMDLQKANVEVKKLQPPLRTRFPWAEYMPRAGWTADGSRIWVQLLDRKQQRFVLATIDVAEFVSEGSEDQSQKPLMSGVHILREETTDIWINISDLIYFFKDGRVLFGSEESSFCHLYLITPDYNTGTNTVRQLTSGEWQVDGDFLEVDEARGLVYFTGTMDTPLEKHLYVISIDESMANKSPSRLTVSNYTHDVALNSDKSMFVTCFSNINEPHKVQIYEISHKVGGLPQATLRATLAKPFVPKKPTKFNINPPNFFSFVNSKGETCYGAYFKPRSFDPTKTYPTILKVYGGPHVQLVTNDYSMNYSFMQLHLYAHLGYLGVVIDGVGSWRRGLKFEGYLRNKMGTVEVQDQVEGLSQLIKQGFVDTERIAVMGWSYGGYLSLMCLAQRPDFFKMAVAGAPVTLWEAYDTGYTERYMDTKDNNPEGYKNGSVLNYASGFPDEPNRLFIIHGMIDENVHFCHTAQLIDELIKLDKPYQLQVYPSERHGFRKWHTSKYYEQTVLRWLSEYL